MTDTEPTFDTARAELEAELCASVSRIRMKYRETYLIMAPPRSCSTTLARVFWQHPEVGFYAHEPFDVTYHRGQGVVEALRNIEHPLALDQVVPGDGRGRSLVIKEMTFQAGEQFPILASLATRPVVFLVRDPRLSIYSRLAKLKETSDRIRFPLAETGWPHLLGQIDWCKHNGISYLVVDATQLRRSPAPVVEQICSEVGLSFSPQLLSWRPLEGVNLGNLAGEQRRWYSRVLCSTGIEEPNEKVPDIEQFGALDGFRTKIRNYLTTYQLLRHDAHAIQAH